MSPALLPFHNEDNFKVNYTVIPYPGVSMIDFRFRFRDNVERDVIVEVLKQSFSNGELKGIYDIIEKDTGPEVHNCTTYSTVLIEENIEVTGENVYFHGYFDNENSVNRFYDLVDYICSKS
jgi:glyceraldehyde 3-phosphate dehydrogenase